MRHRPIIGITTQNLHAIDGIPEGLPQSWMMNQRYILAATNAGGIPWMVPLLEDPAALRAIYDRLDGILLPGGVDLDPATFGERPTARCGRLDPARDQIELQLTRWALEDAKPLLGLCRGIQVINVASGGSLYQDLESEFPDSIKHNYFPTAGYARDYLAHAVALEPGSRLQVAMDRPVITVNSMHHQGIKQLASALVPTAWAPDGLIEGVESEDDHFMVGVQWHPEMFEASDPGTHRLFQKFIEAAGS